jgi:hypothetical protein
VLNYDEAMRIEQADHLLVSYPCVYGLRQQSEQGQRLIRFLDYISRDSRGREVLFVLIGSASATGSMQTNERLSRERSQAPEPIIDQYLLNVPHKY